MTEASKNWVAERGYDTWMGARPMARAIQRHIESPLALALIKGEISDGAHVVIDVDDNRIVFEPASLQKVETVEELSAANVN